MTDMTPTRRSAVMRAKMSLTCGASSEAFERLWARDDLAEVFPGFLVLLHQVMRASVPLMAAAADVARRTAAEDPLSAALVEYFDHHCVEEKDHDLWTMEDLEAAGFDGQSMLDKVPYPDVAAMVGMQYYWIHHHHPVMLLGYIAVLEGFPPDQDHIDDLQRRTGLPAAAFRTYRLHGELDPHHLEDLDRAIDEMPLTRRHMGLIGISTAATSHALAACVDRLGPDDAPARLVR